MSATDAFPYPIPEYGAEPYWAACNEERLLMQRCAACDKFRYIWDGYQGYHDSCGDNLAASLRALGLEPPRFTPQPFNLWMNNPIGANGSIGYLPPVTKPGDYIVLKAEMDCVVAMSACPYDLANVAINGGEVRDVHFQVY